MKKIHSIPVLTLLITVLLSTGLVSCKKTTTGPTGVQGATGLQGPQGNANVKAFNFSTGCNWKADSTSKNYNYRYHIADLTKSVLEDGIVMLYLGDDFGSNGSEWKAMPSSTKEINFSFKIELSTIEIFVSSSTGKMPVNPGSQNFKLVIIPPAS